MESPLDLNQDDFFESYLPNESEDEVVNPIRITRSVPRSRDSVRKAVTHEYHHDVTQLTIFNIIPSPRDDRDWNVEAIHDITRPIPKRLDLRPRLQPPRIQGNQGTCGAHVAACIKEYHENIRNGFTGYMSSQFIYNNRANPLTNSMHGREIMKLLKDFGCCTERLYPIETIESKGEMKAGLFSQAKNFRIAAYARVNTIASLKRALFMNGPCYISFPVYNHTSQMWRQNRDEKKLGGHAMTVIGYCLKGFLLRNSWGVHWDKEGHCLYPYTEWGSHYDVWSSIDDGSYGPIMRPSWNCCGGKKVFHPEDYESVEE